MKNKKEAYGHNIDSNEDGQLGAEKGAEHETVVQTSQETLEVGGSA